MVKVLLTLLLMLPFVVNGLTADELKARMKGVAKEQESAEKRLKFLRSESKSTTMLRERDIFYALPDGRRVEAVLLPNGKKSPAVDGMPACLSISGMLIAGRYEPTSQSVQCDIPDAEIEYIDSDLYKPRGGVGQSEEAQPSQGTSAPVLSKYSSRGRVDQTKSETVTTSRNQSGSGVRNQSGSAPVQSASANPYVYSVPSGSSGKKAEISTFALAVEKPFGVKRGTWAEVSLSRPVSSADSGSVEYLLSDPVVGDFKTLPAGTVLFASKRINESTERLESQVYLAQMPDGEEAKLSGWIYGTNKVAGLPGSLIRDREGESVAAGGNAALAGLRAATNAAGGGAGVAGVVADTYASDMIANEQRYAPDTPGAIIRVSPQRALVQFAEPF
jgi:hypothetical protein